MLDIDNNVIVCEPLRIAYLAIPKCANSSIKHWLINRSGKAGHYVTARVVGYCWNRVARTGFQATTNTFAEKYLSLERLSKFGRADCVWGDDFLKFSFVRNPADRLVSAYVDKIVGGVIARDPKMLRSLLAAMPRVKRQCAPEELSFQEFLELIISQEDAAMDVHWRRQSWFLERFPVDFLGQLETIERDFEIIQSKVGCTIPLVHKNRRPGNARHAESDINLSDVAASDLRRSDTKNWVTASFIGALQSEMIRDRFRQDFAMIAERFPNPEAAPARSTA